MVGNGWYELVKNGWYWLINSGKNLVDIGEFVWVNNWEKWVDFGDLVSVNSGEWWLMMVFVSVSGWVSMQGERLILVNWLVVPLNPAVSRVAAPPSFWPMIHHQVWPACGLCYLQALNYSIFLLIRFLVACRLDDGVTCPYKIIKGVEPPSQPSIRNQCCHIGYQPQVMCQPSTNMQRYTCRTHVAATTQDISMPASRSTSQGLNGCCRWT